MNLLIKSFLWGAVAAASYPSNSLFELQSSWRRHDAQKVQLKSLADVPSVVSMVFLSCKYSCPLTIADMQGIDRELEKTKTPHRMVLISIDPARDTPKAMEMFMKEKKLDPSRWVLLSSESKNIRELAAVLGFRYERDKAMDFAHSMLTWVLDEKGVVRFTREGRESKIDELIQNFPRQK